MHYLSCQEGGSDKFYEIGASGKTVNMRYGKTGSAGVSSTKDFATAEDATKFVDKTIAEKTKKGYVLATGAAAATSTKRQSEDTKTDAGKKQKTENKTEKVESKDEVNN